MTHRSFEPSTWREELRFPWICSLWSVASLIPPWAAPPKAHTAAKIQIILKVSCWNLGLLYTAKLCVLQRAVKMAENRRVQCSHTEKVKKEKITSDLIFFAIYLNLKILTVYDFQWTISGKWIGHEISWYWFQLKKISRFIKPGGKYWPKLKWVILWNDTSQINKQINKNQMNKKPTKNLKTKSIYVP